MSATSLAPGRPAWPALLPGALVVVALLVLFRDTAVAMVGIWMRSDTYAHAFLVPPVAAWLVWRQRASLAGIALRPAPSWLLAMALACLLWLLGELAGVNAASQFALVALLVCTVPLVYGTALARALMFPLAFLFFCVPVGEFLTAPMIDMTADFTVAAIRFTGIPVYREGNQFVIPSGNWSVVEACSGVRYLIASFMVGTLFAYMNFSSLRRRLVFVAFAIAVPIVANWLRAYMIVMLGHLSGNRLAVGVDHLIYGWIFFGIVIAVMFVIGARFADAPAAADAGAHAAVGAPPGSPAKAWIAAASAVAMSLVVQGVHSRLSAPRFADSPVLALPQALPGGWATLEQGTQRWAPVLVNPSTQVVRVYGRGASEVTVRIAYYRNQDTERKLVSSSNVLVDEKSQEWLQQRQGRTSVAARDGTVDWRSAILRSPADPKLAARERLQVLYAYRIAGRFVARDAQAKLLTAFERLLGRGDDGAVVFFSTAIGEEGEGRDELERFVAEHLGTFSAMLDATARMPGAR